MTLKPRTSTSPGTPGATGRPLASATRTSVPGRARPDVVAITDGSSPLRHIVTKPLASDRPYAVRTVSTPSSARRRSTSRSGTTAAPVTTRRRAERSWAAREGWSRRDWWGVGGPGRTEMRSAAMFAGTVSTSNTGCGTIVAPRIRHASTPAL
ncbi:hypothetical protein ADL25_27635 [Streptomyces sp. NRRL F-5122]|nr:hypothetical protein ADL25_27635 [Streptomyces sp. NRRL F-5122]